MSRKEVLPKSAKKNLSYEEVEMHIIQYLTGKILTVIDSSITEPRQNKAVKDLIKNHIRDEMYKLQASASFFDGGDKPSWGHGISFNDEN